MLRILMVEDVPSEAELASRELRRAAIGHEFRRVDSRAALERELEAFDPQLILSDFSLPGFDGFSALEIAQRMRPETPFIFLSGTIGEETAIESLRQGATDYVLKTNPQRLAVAVRRALEQKEQRLVHRRMQLELAASEERFRTLANNAPVGIFLLDAHGETIFANRRLGELIGRDDATVPVPGAPGSRDWAAALHPEDRDRVLRGYMKAAIADLPWQAEFRILTHTGQALWASGNFVSERDPGGNVRGYIGTMMDITERKLAEQRVSRLSRVRAVLSAINAAIVRTHDRAELFRDTCRIMRTEGGFPSAWIGLIEPRGGQISPVEGVGAAPLHFRELRANVALDSAQGHGVISRAVREKRAVLSNDLASDESMLAWRAPLEAAGLHSLIALPLLAGGEAVGALVAHSAERGHFNEEEVRLLDELAADIAYALDHIDREERLNYLAYFDPLTGLPNRDLFEDRLGQLLNDAGTHRRVAAVTLNLERFTLINDTLGRLAGDELLRQVAARMVSYVGGADRLARIGGDNFAVIRTDIESVATLARLLRGSQSRWVAEPFMIAGQEVRVAVRIGVALYPDDGFTPEALLGNAETALRKARATGVPLVFYAADMNARVAERLSLENRLRQALATGQFVLHYQPKIDLASGRVDSLEALIRWHDPSEGLLPPGHFVPLLEETGMILEVGLWALRQALADYRRLCMRVPDPPRLAVNVSPIQLRHPDFVKELEAALADSIAALDGNAEAGHGLDLEITESVVMDDIESNIPKLEALRAMQIGIAVDDFGTGYSSLSYIAKLPINALKIDRAFITHVVEAADSRAIVSSVISLAHALGLKVIAEGVETAAQAQLLLDMGCDIAQGFLYSRPAPLADLGGLLGLPAGDGSS
jgi:diguanylate cyclase (GGDEF)-like protein/PAS domain S-box-containing protein